MDNDKVLLINDEQWKSLAEAAWECRRHAYVFGKTKVGAAALSSKGEIFVGCNVGHHLRCHDVHAEVNAITSMVAAGHRKLIAIIIVSERPFLTPCGGCMDWIIELGGSMCWVGYQSEKGKEIRTFLAQELMPHYPK